MEEVGDIFDAPENSVLIHACNSLGEWGAGIASAFQRRYPNAYKEHIKHCKGFEDGIAPTGTAQLIPPANGDSPRHYIGCLFTSVRFGNSRDAPGTILANTGPAMLDLLRQIREVKKDNPVAEIRICRINSGLFHVPWPSTEAVLNGIDLEEGMETEMTMFQRPT
ncbi:hypothetical protein K490DRAFT_51567 [Saccharata proteae CBS 121410]|uniref:ADP-ribose 1''-phosphate phosphatase n=1 Tax=Saccharata proteae CBS 121410 TaxID=1314787 RepID=A0A9P4HMD3_9PEZI|nr:hypothetical protein K490DRAFT_51567 [Saccharata proteae CBS 121410]